MHVQSDQAVIWAGLPPWVSGRYFFDSALPGPRPPDACVDWTKWSKDNGGRPCGELELVLTIQAKLDVAVVVDTPVVRVVSRRDVEGVAATCGFAIVWSPSGVEGEEAEIAGGDEGDEIELLTF